MSERQDLLRELRHTLEMERASGVEFVSYSSDSSGGAATLAGAATSTTSTARMLVEKNTRAEPRTANVVARSTAPVPIRAAPTALEPVAPLPPPSLPLSGLAATDVAAIAAQIAACERCRLCSTRTTTVPGEGHASPELLFIGEGPGAEEDAQGRPFVGAAGQLLTKMITAMGLRREDVFIANVVKCRPPGNRTPEPDEVAACMPFLVAQVQTLKPRIICTLGNTPLRALMQDDKLGIVKMRGRKLQWQGIPLIPTFHPSYLLRNPSAKKPCWEDLLLVLKELGRTPPPRSTTRS